MLPFHGEPVVRCCVDYAVTIDAGNGVSIRIEQPFVFTNADGVEHLIVPEGNPVKTAPVLAVTRTSVVDAYAFSDGRLELIFGDGSKIGVPADEGYEPWELVGPGGLRVVSVPGGEVAVWRPMD